MNPQKISKKFFEDSNQRRENEMFKVENFGLE